MGRKDFLKLITSEKKQDNLVDCMWNKKKAEGFKTKQEIPCFCFIYKMKLNFLLEMFCKFLLFPHRKLKILLPVHVSCILLLEDLLQKDILDT